MKTIIYALFAVVLVLCSIFSNQRRVVVVVPYCFDAPFGESGNFKPCAEVKRNYEV